MSAAKRTQWRTISKTTGVPTDGSRYGTAGSARKNASEGARAAPFTHNNLPACEATTADGQPCHRPARQFVVDGEQRCLRHKVRGSVKRAELTVSVTITEALWHGLSDVHALAEADVETDPARFDGDTKEALRWLQRLLHNTGQLCRARAGDSAPVPSPSTDQESTS